jgi:hypothetical protein
MENPLGRRGSEDARKDELVLDSHSEDSTPCPARSSGARRRRAGDSPLSRILPALWGGRGKAGPVPRLPGRPPFPPDSPLPPLCGTHHPWRTLRPLPAHSAALRRHLRLVSLRISRRPPHPCPEVRPPTTQAAAGKEATAIAPAPAVSMVPHMEQEPVQAQIPATDRARGTSNQAATPPVSPLEVHTAAAILAAAAPMADRVRASRRPNREPCADRKKCWK